MPADSLRGLLSSAKGTEECIREVGPPNRQTAAFAVRHPLPGRTEWLDGSRWGLFEAGRFEAGWFEAVRSAALWLDININVNMNGSM